MTVGEIALALGAEIACAAEGLARGVTGGYASDLLSCVMAGAKAGNIWVTLQSHVNVIAVAELKELACVLITEGARPDEETLARAAERQVPVLLTPKSTFAAVAALARLGIV